MWFEFYFSSRDKIWFENRFWFRVKMVDTRSELKECMGRVYGENGWEECMGEWIGKVDEQKIWWG